MAGHLRIAVDTGGTFTDVVALDEATGRFAVGKDPTTPGDTIVGLIRTVDKMGLDLSEVARFFVHGATTGLNSILERKGARTALLTTEGFRDVNEIARFKRLQIYNPKYQRPERLVPRRLRLEVRERMLPDGSALVPLDEDSVRAAAAVLRREGVKAVAVCFLHSYKNPIHEQQARDILEKELPGIPISLSSDVAAEHREYERGMTAIIDAYIKPVVGEWVDRLTAELQRRGMNAELLITRSDGGAMGGRLAKESPAHTLLSGPAGGVMGSVFISKYLDEPNIINMDMGGTSLDISVVRGGQASTRASTALEGYELLLPNLDLRTIGAGGGSIGWLDSAGGMHVGPQSAGADPGPIAYGRGGEQPTVTDALAVLGYIDPNNFLGGEMPLDVDRARAGITERLAEPLGMDVLKTAGGILNIAVNNMVQAIRGITVERGDDPRDFSLLCYGGAGALFGAWISDALGMRSVIVPNAPANFSAWGMLTADVTHVFSRTEIMSLNGVEADYVVKMFAGLEALGNEALANERVDEEARVTLRSIDMRYVGQEHYVNVPLAFTIEGDFEQKVKEVFEQTYRSVFGYTLEQPVEMVQFRLAAVGNLPKPDIVKIQAGGEDPAGALTGTRPAYDILNPDGAIPYPVYDRTKLRAGNQVAGPAFIDEATTVTHVPPGWRCTVDPYGYLRMGPDAADSR